MHKIRPRRASKDQQRAFRENQTTFDRDWGQGIVGKEERMAPL